MEQEIEPTRRLAVVNLDWDHVRAIHLFKMFSSLVTSGLPSTGDKKASKPVIRGQVLNVRVYPSDFGRERMAKEEREGPPTELFKKPKEFEHVDEVNEQTIFETGDAADEVDEDALRKYQLERLRYFPLPYGVFGEFVHRWCKDTTMQSQNATLPIPLLIFSTNLMVPSSNGPQMCSI